MKTKLSGLMDGELAGHEAQDLFGALSQDKELRSRWLEYQVIGDALKGERHLDTELTSRIMAGLDTEPTIIAPQRPSTQPPNVHRPAWHRNVMALAATVAGVAVVGWLALGSSQLPQPETVAQTSPISPAKLAKSERKAVPATEGRTAVAAQTVRQASPDMQEYLIAHETQSSMLQFRGGAEHIRTVATFGTAPAK